VNLYGAEEFAHSGDCPGCAECEKTEAALLDVIAATRDINHPLRVAYIDYVMECRTYGVNPLPFIRWVDEAAS